MYAAFEYPSAAGLGDPAAGLTPPSDAPPTPRPPNRQQRALTVSRFQEPFTRT